MNGVVGFVAGVVSFIVAVFTAKPLANMLAGWGVNMRSGFLILICLVVVYVIVRLLFFVLSRYIKKIKEGNRVIDKTDKIAGVFLGGAKWLMSVIVLLTTLHLLSAAPFIADVRDWLLDSGAIGKAMYRAIVVDFVVPLLGDLAKHVIGRPR